MVEAYHAKIIDIGTENLTMEVTGKALIIDELLALLEPFGIRKLSRSGLLALYRES